MVAASDFELGSCRFTLFTPDEEISGKKLLSKLISTWSDMFDADPVVLPLPDGAPRELPRLIFRSALDVWKCEISSASVSFYWNKTRLDAMAPSFPQFFEKALARLNEYIEIIDARVGRLAVVVSRYCEVPDPGWYMAQHFCQEQWLTQPFNRPENFELHAHKTFALSDSLDVNSWVRNRTGTLGSGKDVRPCVLVEQDMNTLSEAQFDASFDSEQRKVFGELVSTALDEILSLYYP